MSVVHGSRSASLLQFYRSAALPCPYLPDRLERKLFTRLTGPDAARTNADLTEAGFRRSHDIVYRPVCPGCQACIPVRIPVDAFRPNRSQRKITRRNARLTTALRPAIATHEQFRLFARYQALRHGDSDMARMGLADYAAMIHEGRNATHVVEFRDDNGPLVGAMLADALPDGYSLIYSFYDPDVPVRSLGTALILSMVDLCRQYGLAHLYLGYWIAQSPKMAYKSAFQPLEALGANGWRRLRMPPSPARTVPTPSRGEALRKTSAK